MENANDISLIKMGVDPPPNAFHVGDLLFLDWSNLQSDDYEFAFYQIMNRDIYDRNFHM